MSMMNNEHPKELVLNDKDAKEQIGGGIAVEELNVAHKSDDTASDNMPSPQQQLGGCGDFWKDSYLSDFGNGFQEETIKKKYGGILPKKPPLISKDHERAFFDSADWALGKGANKPKGPLEALRPKLQPTPHQQVRRSAYAPADEAEVEAGHSNISSEEGQSELEIGEDNDDNKNNTAT